MSLDSDPNTILNIISGSITIFIVLYEFLGARSNSKNPSTILQLLVTALAYILYKYNGYILMSRFNKLQIKYDTSLHQILSQTLKKKSINNDTLKRFVHVGSIRAGHYHRDQYWV